MSFLIKFKPKPAEKPGNVDVSLEIRDVEPEYLKYLEAMLSHHHIDVFSKEIMMRFQVMHTRMVDTLQRKLMGSTFKVQGTEKVEWDALEMALKAEFLRYGMDPVLGSHVVKRVLESNQSVYKFKPVGDQTGLEPQISFLKGQPTPHLLSVEDVEENPNQPDSTNLPVVEPGEEPLQAESSETLTNIYRLVEAEGFTMEDAVAHVSRMLMDLINPSPAAMREMNRLGISIGSSGPLTNRNNRGRIRSALPDMLQYNYQITRDGELRSQGRNIAGISADMVVVDELVDFSQYPSLDDTTRDRIISGDLRPIIHYRPHDEQESESP